MKNLQRWFYIRLLTAVAMVILIIISACFAVSFEFIVYDVFYTLYRLYTLWVVYLYVGELVQEDIYYPTKRPHPDFTVSVISTGRKIGYGDSYTGGAVNGSYVP